MSNPQNNKQHDPETNEPKPVAKGAAAHHTLTDELYKEKKSESNAIKIPEISLPKGGGAIKGIDEKFEVNPSNGTASFSIPFPVTKARNNFEPQLSLSYNSGGGNGVFGMGWGMGLPSVTRKTEKQLPKYFDAQESDVFILSGAEDLVPLLVLDGAEWVPAPSVTIVNPFNTKSYTTKAYRPRIEGLFARIEFCKCTTNDHTMWRSISKDNITTYYGASEGSFISSPLTGKIFSWLFSLSYDSKGSVILAEHKQEDFTNVVQSVFEKNRNAVNSYLSKVYYGNKTPYYPDASGAFEAYATMPGNSDFMFSVAFDYGEYDQAGIGFSDDLNEEIIVGIGDSADAGDGWTCRADSFSNFRAGFEIRTYRRCNRIMMFHHFTELGIEKYLVKSMELVYENELSLSGISSSAQGYSFLTQIIQKGHILNNANTHYISECMPCMSFVYQAHEWSSEVNTMAAEDAVHAPIGLGQNYQWTDLYSEGISGVLSEQGTGWFYKSNLGEGKFSNAQLVYPRPSSGGLSSGALSLQELEGNGVKYLVDYNSNAKGFYKLTPEEEWEPFRYFEGGLPNRNFSDSNAKFIDLNGDGLPDLMISEDSAFLWYESRGEKGFKEAYTVNKPFDEDFGPAVLFNDSTQSIQLADMSGDGLTDIVRIRNGEVCYWPNMGYGKFGNKITMAYAPIYDHPDTFNPKYIRLADIDGSGTTDIVYLGNGTAAVWLNNSGNSFNATPHLIVPVPQVNSLTDISIVDFLGQGTSCLVFSSSLPADKEQPWKYIDLMGGKKPHLMVAYNNSMGKEVGFEYKSSSHFYLEDKAGGNPWATKLPFAVHTLTKVITQDIVTGLKLVNEYSYHHGYYDYEEREFRGFGRVEQKDGEEFIPTGFDEPADPLLQDLILIKSWYHTGAYIRSQKMLDHFAGEYYTNTDVEEHTLPGAVIEWCESSGHRADDIRQAHRACKGMLLRQEVYALNGSANENIPVSTTRQNCYIKQLQPKGSAPHSVFIPLESEKIAYQYEQVANDPRIAHNILLKVNAYGQALLNAAIAYPRLESADDNTQGQQEAMRVIVTEQSYTTALTDDNLHYHIPMAAESKSWEVRKDSTPPAYYSATDFENFDSFTVVAYHNSISANNSKRLIEHSYITYLDDTDNLTELAVGASNKRGNVYQQYALAFTDDLLEAIFEPHETVVGSTAEDNGFIKDGTDYWIPSGRALLSGTPLDDFYLPYTFTDALGSETQAGYDSAYHLYIPVVTDAAGNITEINTLDYRVMAPVRLSDINENRTDFIYDALGRLSATALRAKGQADDFTDFMAILDKTSRDTFFEAPREEALTILVHATACYVYNQHSLPACVATIVRERHYYDVDTLSLEDKTLCSFEYSDGMGHVVLKKVQAEQGTALWINDDDDLMELHPGIGQWLDETDAPAPAPYDALEPHRWVGTGRTVLNNKGNPVMQYEPYFSVTHRYEADSRLVEIGVSPELYYDALGRVVKTNMPDGTFTKVIYSPWKQELWDAGDTVEDSQWYTDRIALASGVDFEAAEKSLANYGNTPQALFFDNLGRPVCSRQHLFDDSHDDVYVYTQLLLDIEGNLLSVTDGLERECMAFKYNMLGQRMYQMHIDSGERWNLTDVMGNPVWQYNTRGTFFTFTYDELHRPLDFKASDGSIEITYQKMSYGEGVPFDTDHNMRGKLFRIFDGSGITYFKDYDFKGNAKESEKVFLEDYTLQPDWGTTMIGSTSSFLTFTAYDALNRPMTIETPDGKITSHSYNEAGLLETVTVNDGSDMEIVENINYNAKGQREEIFFGNGSKTKYFYDAKTFRLVRILTTRNSGADILQDINYTYDAVGNISYVYDDAQQTFYFDNTIINPENDYTYDALYRLIEATGRENFNNVGYYEETTPQALGGNDVQIYTRYFEYDLVGNLTKMQHDASANAFTKHLHYDNGNNNLSSVYIGSSPTAQETFTYDVHGNLLGSRGQVFTYNFLDQLSAASYDDIVDANDWQSYYLYDAQGQRTRKVVVLDNGTVKERLYIGSYESYREVDSAYDLIVERITLQVTDGEKAVAMLDTETGDSTMYRYQYGNNLGSVGLELDHDAEIISYEEYYPFGGTSYYAHDGALDVPKKRYKYCGKEQDEETGLYYYGARYYLPWLCRFASVDPKALEYVFQSSYAYAVNNPIRFIDVNGEGAGDATGSEYIVKKDDTLSEIAEAKGISLQNLRKANKLDPKNDTKLQIGTKLIIPGANVATSTSQYSVTVTDAPGSGSSKEPAPPPPPPPETNEIDPITHRPTGAGALETPFLDPIDLFSGGVLFNLARKATIKTTTIAAEEVITSSEIKVTHAIDDAFDEIKIVSPKVAQAAEVASAEGAVWAQKTFSGTFSEAGKFTGKTVEDVAGMLRSGKLTTADVPIDVVVRNGQTFILNTRSSVALTQANIPRSAWNVVNQTGVSSFESMLTDQLVRNSIINGTNTIRQSGTQLIYTH